MCVYCCPCCFLFFFVYDTATTEIYTLSLHDALPIYERRRDDSGGRTRLHRHRRHAETLGDREHATARSEEHTSELQSLRHLVCRLLLEKKNKIEFIPRQTFYNTHHNRLARRLTDSTR